MSNLNNRFIKHFLTFGLIFPISNSLMADANVPCGNGVTITNVTVFGGSYTSSNVCGNNVTITTSDSKNINGGSETNNTNGIYFAQNGPHPAFIFGDDLTVRTSGSFVDAIRTNGQQASNGVYTVIAGDRATLIATGSNSNGINVAQSPNGQAGYGRVYLGSNSTITVDSGTAVRVNLSSQAPYYNLAYVADNSIITAGGTGTNGTNSMGYAVYAGNRDSVLTNGTAYGTNAVAIIGSGATITSTGSEGHAVYANKGGVVQLQGTAGATSVSAEGDNADGLRAEKKLTADNNFNALGGRIELTGDAIISVNALNGGYAMHTLGEGSVISSAQTNYYIGSDDKLYNGAGSIVNDAAKTTNSTSGIYTITGNLFAESGLIDLNMTDGSQFTGMTKVGEYAYTDASSAPVTDAKGNINLNINGVNSVWNMTADSEMTNLTLDGATLKYVEPAAGSTLFPKTLIVNGNYAATNGTLVLNTVLGNDSSSTDKLIVKGDTSGHTDVRIVNAGGNGALTTSGIEIVEVEGNSAGTFGNSQRIVAGAFDYFVRSGSTIAGANANNWYLVSQSGSVNPPNPTPDPDPTPTPNPDPEVDPVSPYRPESGSYLANLAAANTMFITRLHDRLGETQYTDALTGEKRVTSMWMRQVGEHLRFSDSSSQLRTRSNSYVVQIGGDLAQWSNNDLDRWHVGLMAGYANNHNQTRSSLTGFTSKGNVSGYSAGLYGTWYANNVDKTGTYVDTWVMYSWFDNEVKGDQLATESYKSNGVTASIESGYSFKLGGDERKSYWVQPKAQVIWMGVDADNHVEQNGTRVTSKADDNIMTRLGVRAYVKGHHEMDDGKDREFEPFIELNWIYNTEDYTVKMNQYENSQSGAKNLGEVKLGVEGKLNNNLTGWVNTGYQFGSHAYNDVQAMFGVKYSF